MKIKLTDLPAYYINIDPIKAAATENLLKSLGFKIITRFPGIKKDPKREGVAQSHKLMLEHLSNAELPAIVFEDDISVYKFADNIEVPEAADAMYLGNSCFGLYNGIGRKRIAVEPYNSDTFRIYNMLAAHAIVYLNKDYVDFLNKAIEFNISVKTNQDKARAETMKYWNIYARKQPMFYQNGLHEQFTKIDLPSEFGVGPDDVFKPFEC